MSQKLSFEELKIMREAGKVISYILKKLKDIVKPGINTKNIEDSFDRIIEKYKGMEPAFKGFRGFPASLCVSVNEEVIHGIPGQRRVNNGDVVSVDLGIKYKGLFVDAAYTYLVGKVSGLAKNLVKTTWRALYGGIKKVKPGSFVGDIGFAIQNFVERKGYSVIRKFVGHGIGKELHLPPEVPNFGKNGEGEPIVEGMVLAIEPMVVAGSSEVEILSDGWTVKTKDNSLSAHFEHTVAVTKKGVWILTA
ncbi:MAG TPA: type I methionyl aminopeptidase [Candidatus Omnitrophica bacterium]|nr:type I methionyl aminopeptidase [Candidatus Omnitrophota bacterium]